MAGTNGDRGKEGNNVRLFAGPAATTGGIYAPALRALTTSVIEDSVPTFPGKTM